MEDGFGVLGCDVVLALAFIEQSVLLPEEVPASNPRSKVAFCQRKLCGFHQHFVIKRIRGQVFPHLSYVG